MRVASAARCSSVCLPGQHTRPTPSARRPGVRLGLAACGPQPGSESWESSPDERGPINCSPGSVIPAKGCLLESSLEQKNASTQGPLLTLVPSDSTGWTEGGLTWILPPAAPSPRWSPCRGNLGTDIPEAGFQTGTTWPLPPVAPHPPGASEPQAGQGKPPSGLPLSHSWSLASQSPSAHPAPYKAQQAGLVLEADTEGKAAPHVCLRGPHPPWTPEPAQEPVANPRS